MSIYKRVINKIMQPFRLAYDTGKYFVNTKSLPNMFDIEVTNLCNANCIFCAHQYDI